jgi:glyoxylase-like metal-dependent hydrolase (beta-lactamase superfamily II)
VTTLTRREFTRLVALAGGAVALPGAAGAAFRQDGAPTTVFDWSPLGPDGAYLCAGQGGNALVVASAGESMLVDTKNAGFGHALKAEAEKQGAPLRWVVNTHHHADHTGGNYAFTGEFRVLAHRNAEPRIIADAQFKQFINTCAGVGENALQAAPTDPRAQALVDASPRNFFLSGFARLEAADWGPTLLMDDERELAVGTTAANLRHIGAGHTDNDVFIYLPDLNILHTGDLCFHGLHPFFDRPAGANTAGWIRSNQAMLEVCNDDTIVVPGHGEVGGPDIMRAQIEYFEKTVDAVQAAIDDGLERDAIVKMTFEHFEGLGFEQLKERVLGAVYDELTGAPTG